jgi:glycosyltransferase involved in cell wall biosynthesis
MVLFSIIIPSFNRSGIILTAIGSVLNQVWTDYEIIVVDDGSTDSTGEVLKPLVSQNKIKLITQENRGVCAARNAGASVAQGEYLVFLDSDDTVATNWLADFETVISAGGNPDLVFCSMEVLKPNGSKKQISCLDPYNNGGKEKGLALAGAWVIKAEVFNAIGGFDEAIRYGENTELKFRWTVHGVTQQFIDRCNITYHESQSGGSKQTENKLRSNLYMLEKHAGYFEKNLRVKRLFLQVAAVSAVRLKDTRQAHGLFVQAWKSKPLDLKLMAQCILTLFPALSKKVWASHSINSN